MPASKLQRELKKRQPFHSLEDEATRSLLRTNDVLHIRFTRLLRKYGLTPAQYNILRILRGEGSPLPSLEIASRLVAVVPGITGLIDRLETVGLVRRARCERDRRVIHVAATPRALALLGRLDEPVRALHKALLGHMTRRELTDLIRLLEKARRYAGDGRQND